LSVSHRDDHPGKVEALTLKQTASVANQYRALKKIITGLAGLLPEAAPTP